MLKTARNVEEALSALPLQLDRIHSELSAGLAQFQGINRLDGARALPAGGRALAWNGAGRLVGWSVKATGGSVTCIVRNGRDENGDQVAVIDLVDGESDTQGFGGVSCPDGLYLDRTGAGTLTGAVWLGAVD